MEGRASGALAGGAMGIVLVLALAAVAPPGAPGPGFIPQPPPSSVAGAPDIPALGPASLYAAFDRLGRARSHRTPVDLSVSRPGELVLPTGRIVAGDAFFFGLQNPVLDRAAAAGAYPVRILWAEGRRFSRVAAAVDVEVGARSPVSWEPATWRGLPAVVGVDSGTVGVASAEVEEALAGNPEGAAALSDRLLAALGDEGAAWAVVPLGAADGPNVVAVASGFGDGGYGMWWGLDEAGVPVALVVDFAVLDGD